MDTRKTFLLGVGSQKAGTSWLHKALASQSECDFGFAKEYHALNAMYLPEANIRRQEVIQKWLEKREGHYSTWRGAPKSIQLSFLLNHGAYYDFFASLLRHPSIRVTGDITPIYSSLPEDVFATVKREFEARSVSVKPVFIMRNPVYRLRSYVRMVFRDAGVDPSYEEEIEAMRGYVGTYEDMRRVNYKNTVQSLANVFGKSALFFFYEDFFNPKAMRVIEEVTGMEVRGVKYRQKVGSSGDGHLLLEEDYRDFEVAYQDIFDYCRRAFPTVQIDRIWRYSPSR